jgi:hypothetical protein
MYPTGDINQDGTVNAIDLSLLVSRWNTNDPDADLNNDGTVNAIDLSLLVSNWGATGTPTGTALLVTNESTLSAGNQALRTILSAAGYAVTTRTWTEAENYTGIDVVVVSTGNPPGDSGKYMNPPVGMVAIDSWRPLGMGTNLGFLNNVNEVQITNPSHPIAAGISGTHAAYSEPRYITWELDLSANPTVIATRPNQAGQAVIFAYEAGNTMTTRYATTRHVGLGYHEQGLAIGLSTQARSQLLAAVAWARASTYVAPPAVPIPAAPTGLTATASSTQVSLTWNTVSGATSYNVKRSTTSGGPYTTIQSNVTTTSFTNTGLTNGTTYYYVVSAVNTAGQSPNSTQVSATPVVGSGTTQYLGLHTSQAELTIWRNRWANGVSGDAFLTARINDEKTRVTNNRNSFNTSEANGLFWFDAMNTDAQGRYISGAANGLDARTRASRFRDAAFHALVTQDATMMTKVRTALPKQPDQTRCNFVSDPGWAPGSEQMINANTPGFSVAHAVVAHIHAYDYFRIAVKEGWATDLTAADKTKLENWYRAFAEFCRVPNESRANVFFVNRPAGNYTLTSAAAAGWPTTFLGPNPWTFNGGRKIYSLHDRWNNRSLSCQRMCTLTGVMFNDTALLNQSYLWMRDWLRYGLFPDGGVSDNHRAHIDKISQDYMALSVAHALTSIDALARHSKSLNLYDHSTTVGALGSEGAPSANGGGHETAKSVLFAARQIARYGRYQTGEYGGRMANASTPWNLNLRGPFTGALSAKPSLGNHDRLLQATVALNDTGVLRDYYRGINGQPAWEVCGNGGTDLNDAWAYAAPYLQWAGLEGQVSPYPTS